MKLYETYLGGKEVLENVRYVMIVRERRCYRTYKRVLEGTLKGMLEGTLECVFKGVFNIFNSVPLLMMG